MQLKISIRDNQLLTVRPAHAQIEFLKTRKINLIVTPRYDQKINLFETRSCEQKICS